MLPVHSHRRKRTCTGAGTGDPPSRAATRKEAIPVAFCPSGRNCRIVGSFKLAVMNAFAVRPAGSRDNYEAETVGIGVAVRIASRWGDRPCAAKCKAVQCRPARDVAGAGGFAAAPDGNSGRGHSVPAVVNGLSLPAALRAWHPDAMRRVAAWNWRCGVGGAMNQGQNRAARRSGGRCSIHWPARSI